MSTIMTGETNVLGGPLELCSTDPMTGKHGLDSLMLYLLIGPSPAFESA
jgi:hypothetical protein